MTLKSVRSPLFYVGDKYKLMPQLRELFPDNINTFFDVFCGGGSASINTPAKRYVLNDINKKIIELHRFLLSQSTNMESFIKEMHKEINNYGLSLSELGNNTEIEKLKKEYKKTYFAKFNKESYVKLRKNYNKNQSNTKLLYLLLVYGFNHMIRFNNSGEFNLPVGNVDWNKNVTNSLLGYSKWGKDNNIILTSGMDFERFIEEQDINKDDFIYFDPPYLITNSEYNKFWNEVEEKRLYALLDKLDKEGIKWGLSNMFRHKGKENNLLIEWSDKYHTYNINSNYISRFDNSIKIESREIYVTNYKK